MNVLLRSRHSAISIDDLATSKLALAAAAPQWLARIRAQRLLLNWRAGKPTLSRMLRLPRDRTIECLLFAAASIAYGYFHQGGGWAQNARFAMVRAIVEEGRYWIDDYLIYTRAENSNQPTALVRPRVQDAAYEQNGKTCALTWMDALGRETFISDRVAPDAKPVLIGSATVSGDLVYVRGHFHPLKPPGLSLLAAVPYYVIYHVERLVGANPDDWWTLTCNAWLTCVFSVGLLSAFGCVLVFRLALAFSAGKTVPSLWTAVIFAFGTMFFPMATMLQDPNIAAVLMLASF